MSFRGPFRIAAFLLVFSVSGFVSSLQAQQGGAPRGGGPGGGPPSGRMNGGAPGDMNNGPGGMAPGPGNGPNNGPPPSGAPAERATVSTMPGGLQLGPPGRWWDDKHFAKELRLRPEQEKKMDSIFDQNRAALLRTYENLQQEEQRMKALVDTPAHDENSLFAQIDRVAQARAALEKANTHLMLQIRGEMSPDQIARLQQHR
jgi:Spy/CpxP family protein refolding chaperone